LRISEIQYGGSRHLEKLKNRDILAMDLWILMKFGTMMHLTISAQLLSANEI